MERFPLITRTKYAIIALCFGLGLASAVEATAPRSYLNNSKLIIDINGIIIDKNRMGIGGTPNYELDVFGSARFRGATGIVPVSSSLSTIDWSMSPHQFITVFNSAVTQSITFVNPSAPCTLFLVVSRNIGISFPGQVQWVGGATMTFPTPVNTTLGQLDIFSFVFDGTNYIGVANLDFKVPLTNIGGK